MNGCFELESRDIHVWVLDLGVPDALITNLEPLLTLDEKEHATHLRFADLRRSFIARRGVLRSLLGRYLRIQPASVCLTYGVNGKPFISSDTGIEFNITHSGDLAAFAFTLGCSIGIDLEQIRSMVETQSILTQFFCPEESAEIMSLPLSEQNGAFFRCWTRKEAYVKGRGDGLSTALDSFRVTSAPGEPARLISVADDQSASDTWTLHDLRLAPDYAASLAYNDGPRRVKVFRIQNALELLDNSFTASIEPGTVITAPATTELGPDAPRETPEYMSPPERCKE